MRTLSDKGQELMDDLPAYFAESEATRGVVDSVARELTRVEDTAVDIRSKAFPVNSDDTYRLLSIWETQCGLPVSPEGATIEQRRSYVLSHLRGRRRGSGRNWVDAMTTALGTSLWSYHESAPNQLTLVIPFGAGTLSATQAVAIAEKLTPANTQITVTYTGTFLLDVSELDGTDGLG